MAQGEPIQTDLHVTATTTNGRLTGERRHAGSHLLFIFCRSDDHKKVYVAALFVFACVSLSKRRHVDR